MTERDAQLLQAFSYYSDAALRAESENWPDDALSAWRCRRASIARLLSRNGPMQQIADVCKSILNKSTAHEKPAAVL
jgi:hypothetical protein